MDNRTVGIGLGVIMFLTGLLLHIVSANDHWSHHGNVAMDDETRRERSSILATTHLSPCTRHI